MSKIKNIIKVVASVLIFAVLFVGIDKTIGFFTNDDTLYFSRVSIKEMYKTKDIDTLYLGSSVCFYALDPEFIDKNLGTNSFNLATMHQGLDGSYALLKEADKNHDIKTVYVDLFYSIATLYENEERRDLTSVYLITDYMHPSFNKVSYAINASNDEHYFNTFLVARRNWKYLLDPAYMKEVAAKKLTKTYLTGGLIYKESKPNEYKARGFVYNYKALQTEGNFFKEGGHAPIKIERLSKDWIKALDNIIAYCDKHDIELNFIATPISNYRLMCVGNYDEYINFIKHRIEGTKANYYDFNLLREEYFPDTTTNFSDDHHMSMQGTEYFEQAFCMLMSGEATREELFYNSIEEKFALMDKNIFGFKMTKGEDYELTLTPVASLNEGEFSYYIEVQNADRELLWSYDTNKDDGIMTADHGVHFTYSDEHCVIIVQCFVDGEMRAQAAFELNK